MISRYLNWSKTELQMELERLERAVKDHSHLLNSEEPTLVYYAKTKTKKWQGEIVVLKALLKPTIDYEDGSWV